MLAFSPSGRYLASAGHTGLIQLWEVASGKEVYRFNGHTDEVLALAFSPDGNFLVSGGMDEAVLCWEMATGRQVQDLRGHSRPIHALAYSYDGKLIASGSDDTTILVWEAPTIQGHGQQEQKLTDAEMAKLWNDLATADASKAFKAVEQLAAMPKKAPEFMKQLLRPVQPCSKERIAKLISQLDDNKFEVREKATRELTRLRVMAEPGLRLALNGHQSLEARRRIRELISKLQGPITSTDELRAIRAIEVLERIDSPESPLILERIAKGEQASLVTQEAAAALVHLGKRSKPSPK